MRPLARHGADLAEREQAAMERKNRQEKAERIVRAVRLDPELSVPDLEERFGWLPETIANTLHRAGYWWDWGELQWVRR